MNKFQKNFNFVEVMLLYSLYYAVNFNIINELR